MPENTTKTLLMSCKKGRMKLVKAGSLTLLIIATIMGCGGGGGGPTAPPPPACQTNNTAEVVFQNGSVAVTYSVVWDGEVLTTLAPDTRATFNLAAGEHTLEFIDTNTNRQACDFMPTLEQCSESLFFCATF